ncbi:Pancreatic lipase-related protein 2 [Halotydeus destructor]|nr:Pancreatic lipase-related protein 2 [Halotydeus destructor]
MPCTIFVGLTLALISSLKCDVVPSQPLDPAMVPLVEHHRLLGFVAMMDEPHHHLRLKPTLPKILGTKFFLFDNSSIRGPKRLAPGTAISYKQPGQYFEKLKDKYNKVYFLAHDFQEVYENDPYEELAHDLLSYRTDEKPAVILVDWRNGSMSDTSGKHLLPELMKHIYGQAVANAIVVGREVALLSYILTNKFVISRENIHYIGSGLGAQVMHFAGQWYSQLQDEVHEHMGGLRGTWKIGRITGLDPSARDFQGYGTVVKLPYLNQQDAEFVDIIHTSSVKDGGDENDIMNRRFGMSVLAGHADFYPNGGQVQPFCGDALRCSHEKALLYFMASVTSNTTVYKMLLSQEMKSHRDFLTLKPTPRPSLFKTLLTKPAKVSSVSSQRYMGIEANLHRPMRKEDRRHGFYLDFALDFESKPAVVDSRLPVELQLVDILQPNAVSREGYNFSAFPVRQPTKMISLHPLETPGCGRFLVPPSGQGRVHYGIHPYVKQFPWNVCIAIVDEDEDEETFVTIGCTGALISPDFVITAAHCFDDYAIEQGRSHPKLRSDNRPVYLLFGIDCLRPILVRKIPVRQGVTVFIHPSYILDGVETTNLDIALIKLVAPVPAAMLPVDGQFTNTTVLNTVCWLSSRQFDYSDTCEELYYAGYGTNDDVADISSDGLRWTIMKIIQTSGTRHPTEIVAVNAEHHRLRNTCPGDSGGPLTQIVKTTAGQSQLFDQVSPYTAIIVGTLMGGPPPCAGSGKQTTFCKVGHVEVHSWIRAILTANSGPVPILLQAAPVDMDINTLLRSI